MINFALAGRGRIAKRHSELLELNKIKNVRLAAVCDIKQGRAKAIGMSKNVHYYSDIHEMMRSESVDVVVVLTESGLQADHVEALALYGRHILVEKPFVGGC